jgi:ABC-2 type transport system ATP-binding protein
MILNVVNKTSGNFEWFDGQLNTTQALKKIGAIIERPNFYPYMSAYQNLELVCKIKEIPSSGIQEKLELVGLADRQHDKFKTYSLGMKQRLAIASALLNDPELLILDEPTNGLDPKGIHEIRNIITTIAETGKTIILASHLLDEVEKVCSHVIILQEGSKIFEGKVSEISIRQSWFEITCEQTGNLISQLQNHPAIEKVELENQFVKAYISGDLKGSDLNKYLVNNGIYIDSLVKKQPTLEEEFLKITG